MESSDNVTDQKKKYFIDWVYNKKGGKWFYIQCPTPFCVL